MYRALSLFLVVVVVVTGFHLDHSIISSALAQESCGTITDRFGNVEPIEDCDNPLGPELSNDSLTFLFGQTALEEGEQYDLLGASGELNANGIDPDANAVFLSLVRHDGENFIEEAVRFEETFQFTVPATYSVVIEEELLILSHNWWEQLLAYLTPSAHAAIGDRTIITFEITGETIEPCGIIFGAEEEEIFDCDDPFGVSEGFPYTLQIGDTTIVESEQHVLPFNTNLTLSLERDGDPANTDHLGLYRKLSGNDLEEVYKNQPADDPVVTLTDAGEYIAVVERFLDNDEEEDGGNNGDVSLLESLVAAAHAQTIPDDDAGGEDDANELSERFAIEFTISEETTEPQGASSVLFLPGIQASRLYERQIGFDAQRWEPFGNRDIRALAMTETGESVNDIYTEDILNAIYGISNIYRSFMNSMDELHNGY